jgi:hypothetical protein
LVILHSGRITFKGELFSQSFLIKWIFNEIFEPGEGRCPMEDFPPLGIPNVHGLIPDSKPYLVVKIIDI